MAQEPFPTFSKAWNQTKAWIRQHPEAFWLFIGALLLRLLVIAFYKYPIFLSDSVLSLIVANNDDQVSYLTLSDSLAAKGEFTKLVQETYPHGFVGDVLTPYGYRPPVYPFFLVFVRGLFGGHLLSVRIVQAILGALCAPLIFATAKNLYNQKVGWVAGVAAGFFPFFVYWTLFITPTIPLIFCVSLSIYWISRYIRNPNARDLIIISLLFAFAGLIRPEGFYAGILAMGLLYLHHFKIYRSRALGHVLIAATLIGVLWFPWALRNRIQFGVWKPMQIGVLGMNLIASASYNYSLYEWPEKERLIRSLSTQSLHLSAKEMDRHITREWIKFLLQHPRQAFELHALKFRNFWRVLPQSQFPSEIEGQTRRNLYGESKIKWAAILSFGVLLPFFVLHVLKMPFTDRKSLPIFAVIFAACAIGVLTNPNIRIRNQFDIIVILFASVEILWLWEQVAKKAPISLKSGLWKRFKGTQ